MIRTSIVAFIFKYLSVLRLRTTFGGMWRCRRVAVARVFALVVRCRIMRLLLYSRVGKNRDTSGSPRRCRGGLCRCTANSHLWLESSRGTEGNAIYRPVRDSSGFNFLSSEQSRTHLSRDKQVPLSTQQAATHPMKRSPGAELGGNRGTCLTSY